MRTSNSLDNCNGTKIPEFLYNTLGLSAFMDHHQHTVFDIHVQLQQDEALVKIQYIYY